MEEGLNDPFPAPLLAGLRPAASAGPPFPALPPAVGVSPCAPAGAPHTMDELAGGGGGGPGMAAPPRQQQGPGGNLGLSPGGNGAAGGGGPPASEGTGPAAGPELSRPQQYTIPGILHYIQHEWARFEMERAHWEVERAELQVPRWGRCAGRLRRRGS
ncbi:Striatin-3 [Saguinus oedipus]|uniref:Striatin-3 n=1 Tax=Saguinus oedipus TaxID=9490 RepID=A0ABQ9V3V7_SAGOE|nr:Striatin-3 [Saguinus oedipus]